MVHAPGEGWDCGLAAAHAEAGAATDVVLPALVVGVHGSKPRELAADLADRAHAKRLLASAHHERAGADAEVVFLLRIEAVRQEIFGLGQRHHLIPKPLDLLGPGLGEAIVSISSTRFLRSASTFSISRQRASSSGASRRITTGWKWSSWWPSPRCALGFCQNLIRCRRFIGALILFPVKIF